MARKLRVQYEGAIYHVMNRGDHREDIFRNDKDRELFLETLGQACAKTDWQIHAWCLMRNHFHLVVETPKANLVEGMKWLLGTYTARFNRRHKLFGHLFSGRYKALVVAGVGNGYLKTLCDYVHLNPARAKLLSGGQKLSAYRWSSYGEYLKDASRRWRWLRVDRLLGEHGIPKDSPAGRQEFGQRMELRRAAEDGKEFKAIQSEEHTSELQSLRHLVCRLLLEKKKEEKTRILKLIAAHMVRRLAYPSPNELVPFVRLYSEGSIESMTIREYWYMKVHCRHLE